MTEILTAPAWLQPARRPLVGPLRIANKLFVDDTGPRRVFFCSSFDALRVLRDRPAEFMRQLDVIAQSYQGTRTFWAVGGYTGFWGGHEIAPVTFTQDSGAVVPAWPDFEDLFRALLRAYKARGLRLFLTTGDGQFLMPDPAVELAQHQRVARIAAEEGGSAVIACWEVVNEWYANYPVSGDPAWARMRAVAAAVKALLPDVIVCTSDSGSEDPSALELATAGSDCCQVHGTRQPPETAIDHAMHLVTWGAGQYRFWRAPFWQGEPAGPGSYNAEGDPAYLTALYAIHQITGQASVFHSGAGVKNDAPLESAWGFRELPALFDRLFPEDLATWPGTGFAPGGAIQWWWGDAQAVTVAVEGWDFTPAVPLRSATVVIGDQIHEGITDLRAVLTPGYKAALILGARA